MDPRRVVARCLCSSARSRVWASSTSHRRSVNRSTRKSSCSPRKKKSVRLLRVSPVRRRSGGPDSAIRARSTTSKSASRNARDGEPYVHLTSTEPVNEPFLDLLVELSWSSGRISREFTALLDPPSLIADRAKAESRRGRGTAPPRPKPEPKPEPLPSSGQPTRKPRRHSPAMLRCCRNACCGSSRRARKPRRSRGPPRRRRTRPVRTGRNHRRSEADLPYRNECQAPRGRFCASAAARESYGPVKTRRHAGQDCPCQQTGRRQPRPDACPAVPRQSGCVLGQEHEPPEDRQDLQLPTPDQYGSYRASDARKEVLAQASATGMPIANKWRLRPARSMPAAEPAQQYAAGKVTPTVEDKAAQGEEATQGSAQAFQERTGCRR